MVAITNKEQLKRQIVELISHDNPEYHSLTAYVRINLRRYGQRHCDVLEIVSEAYQRAHKAVENDKTIVNLPAWMRVTITNILREKKRESKRQIELAHRSYVDECIVENMFSDIDRRVQNAFKSLSRPDRAILIYRFIEEFSYKEISRLLSSDEGKKISESTVRKRVCRAKQRFQDAYEDEDERAA